jgi:pyruvate dehydrogenase E1 component beta subunit
MKLDDKVFIMGEDIAGGSTNPEFESKTGLGGGFGVTVGLVEQFGRKRVMDMPISEAGFVGMAIGAAFAGLRPIAEVMYVDFMGVCYDQILNQASKMFYMYGGKKPLPMVIRTVCGAGFRAGAEHGQMLYNMFVSIPGLKVVAPSNAYDAKGLLATAIQDNDPVVFLEHKRTYMLECEVPEEPYTIPFGVANVARQGSDVTVIALHLMVQKALEAAEELAKEGISVEVIDPRTLSPLDLDTLLKSARKTKRVVIVDESYPRCGMAADISAQITENTFNQLSAPVKRVVPPHAHIPFCGPLEDEWIPNETKIISAVKEVLSY